MRPRINPGRSFRLVSALAVLGLAAAATPAVSSASTHHAQDVRAKLTHDGTQRSTAAIGPTPSLGDRTQLQVDVGDDGSPDFSFPVIDIRAIDVNMGRGDDAVRIDDANGVFTNTIRPRSPAAPVTTR